MIYRTTLLVEVPGASVDDALNRVKTRLAGWKFDVADIRQTDDQPAPITGTSEINLPSVGYVNGR